MAHYVLYFKKCPGVLDPRHFKVGIAALSSVRSRLATYQNAVGPVWEENFIRIWLGPERHVREAEKQFKLNFKDKISSAEAGLSEWICDITLDEMLSFVTDLREEYFIKLTDAPIGFQPLTMPLCADLQDWYLNFLDNK
jgi:hypothetical protein